MSVTVGEKRYIGIWCHGNRRNEKTFPKVVWTLGNMGHAFWDDAAIEGIHYIVSSIQSKKHPATYRWEIDYLPI